MRGDRSLGGGPSGDPGTTLGQRGAKVPAQCPRLLTSPVAGRMRHHSALHGRVCPGPADTQPHGSHKARPQESSSGTKDPALQSGLRGATQTQARPG